MPHVSSHDFSTKLVTTLVRMLLCCTSHVPPYINLTLPIISKSLIELGENCLVKVLERKVVANGRDSRLFVKFTVCEISCHSAMVYAISDRVDNVNQSRVE
jgi:hypothetical protein